MRRRTFVESCGAALTVAMASGLRAQPEDSLPGLLALAGTVIPDRDPAVWSAGSPEAAELRRIWLSLERQEMAELSSALGELDAAAVRESGAKFEALEPGARAALVRRLLESPGSFKPAFPRLRGMIVRSFYSSPAGFERTGFSATSQFTGYPEPLWAAEYRK